MRGELTYAIPAPLSGQIDVGHVVLVPFGARRSETGYVVGLTDETALDPAKIKAITRLLDRRPAFDGAQLQFFRWVGDYYLAPLGMVIQTAVPSGLKARVLTVLEPTEEGIEALTAGLIEASVGLVLREIISRPGLTRRGLERRLAAELDGDEAAKVVDRVLQHGWARWSEREQKEIKGLVRTVELAVPRSRVLELVPRAGHRMLAIVDSLAGAGARDLQEVGAEQGASASGSIERLVEAGVLRLGEREDRDVLADAPALGPATAPPLNPAQIAAVAALTAPGATGTFTLFGVTGSGKTEVFLGAARHTLDHGRQVLVLVPEIGLTPQLVGRFRARFGDEVAVLHSGLTGADRLAQWRRIRAGEARVVVGARSALFAPFGALGLIVVDEEHDDSYKQDDGVRYHARDMAVVLGRACEAPVVLASATPSLETWHNTVQGRYTMLELPHRATARAVPSVEVVDLTAVDRPEGSPPPLLAPEVVDALRRTFAAGGKAIVLYNRRGYATMVQCGSCGGTWECPNCGITMTLHRRARNVACHYCGLKRPYTGQCPACASHDLHDLGTGTERVEEELGKLFPGIPRARMDADTTTVRGAHHRILADFREGRTSLLVGTQIVAKGHDFPDVHTAVVVSADHGFRLPDFRAAERTFALLVQLAGRAGRGEVPGRVFVQTWAPDHYVLQRIGSLRAFYEHELRLRRTLRYPPYQRLTLVRLDGVDRDAVFDHARALAVDLRKAARGCPVDVLGPSAAALAKLIGRWRFQVIVRSEQVGAFRRWLAAQRERIEQAGKKGVRVTIDVDPRSLL